MHLQERWNNLCLSFLFRLHNIKKTYKKKDKKTEALRGMKAAILISAKGEDSQLCIYFRWSKKENNTCIAWKIVQNIDATGYYFIHFIPTDFPFLQKVKRIRKLFYVFSANSRAASSAFSFSFAEYFFNFP